MRVGPKHISSLQFSRLNEVQRKNQRKVNQPEVTEKGVIHQIEAHTALSNEEKLFFEKLFPNAVAEIRSYQVYQRQGLKSTSELGKLIDVKR